MTTGFLKKSDDAKIHGRARANSVQSVIFCVVIHWFIA